MNLDATCTQGLTKLASLKQLLQAQSDPSSCHFSAQNLCCVVSDAEPYACDICSAVGMLPRPNCLRVNEHELQLKISWVCGKLPEYAALAMDACAACAARAGDSAFVAAAVVAAASAARGSAILL